MQITNNNIQNLQYNIKSDPQTAKAAETGKSLSDVAVNSRAEMQGNAAELTGADAAIEKALEQAGLPKTEKNILVARQLLENQMGVSKDNLRQLIQQSNIFREADVSTLLLMNKNNIPITHFTAAQLQGYIDNEQNLLQQLGDAVGDFTEMLSGENGVEANASILDILTENPETLIKNQLLEENVSQNATTADVNGSGLAETAGQLSGEMATVTNANSENLESNGAGLDAQTATSEAGANPSIDAASHQAVLTNSETDSGTAAETIKAFASPLTSAETSELSAALKNITGQNTNLEGMDTNTLLNQIKEAITGKDSPAIRELISSPAYKQLIKKAFGEKFTMDPEDIKDSDSINNYYKSTYSALSKMMEMAQKNGNEQLADKLSKPMDNVKFMDTINNVMPFIQLPLKFESGATHGELFVFKNGRNKTSPEDVKSVLLHLDMDSLGPTDIHMKLDHSRLNLKFYCNDDPSMKLLSDKITELSEALKAKGFDLSSEFSVRENSSTPMEEALSGSSGHEPAFVYGFDIRA